MLPVKYTEYGLASRIGDTIYLNEKLLNHPKLCKAILKHEQAHSSGFEKKDILIDIKGKFLSDVKKEYYKFLLKNPKTWTQFIPIWKYDQKIVIDPMMFLFWILIILIPLIIWSII